MAEPDRREFALELYRQGRLEIERFVGRELDVRTQYFVDELMEALLDLKQATLADDVQAIMRYGDEVGALVFELRMLDDDNATD